MKDRKKFRYENRIVDGCVIRYNNIITTIGTASGRHCTRMRMRLQPNVCRNIAGPVAIRERARLCGRRKNKKNHIDVLRLFGLPGTHERARRRVIVGYYDFLRFFYTRPYDSIMVIICFHTLFSILR